MLADEIEITCEQLLVENDEEVALSQLVLILPYLRTSKSHQAVWQLISKFASTHLVAKALICNIDLLYHLKPISDSIDFTLFDFIISKMLIGREIFSEISIPSKWTMSSFKGVL
jgi:hypothetical protein